MQAPVDTESMGRGWCWWQQYRQSWRGAVGAGCGKEQWWGGLGRAWFHPHQAAPEVGNIIMHWCSSSLYVPQRAYCPILQLPRLLYITGYDFQFCKSHFYSFAWFNSYGISMYHRMPQILLYYTETFLCTLDYYEGKLFVMLWWLNCCCIKSANKNDSLYYFHLVYHD